MRKRGLVIFVLFSLLFILGGLTFFGDKGILHLFRVQKELIRIKETNKRIEGANRKLQEEVRKLRYEKRYIEEIARKELGMVREDEIVYQFDPTPPHPAPLPSWERERRLSPPPSGERNGVRGGH